MYLIRDTPSDRDVFVIWELPGRVVSCISRPRSARAFSSGASPVLAVVCGAPVTVKARRSRPRSGVVLTVTDTPSLHSPGRGMGL